MNDTVTVEEINKAIEALETLRTDMTVNTTATDPVPTVDPAVEATPVA